MPTTTKAVILTKIYDILLWIIPQLEKFPRSQRFFLGDRIEKMLLDILELVIQAIYTKNKLDSLQAANLTLEKIRFIVRLSKDLKYFSISKYEYFTKAIDEIGKMVGGWIKHVEKR